MANRRGVVKVDARKMSLKVIREAIEKEAFEFTGITENGEIVLAIMGDSEKTILNEILENKKTEEEKLREVEKAMSVRGRNAQEYMQIYLQSIAKKNEACKANGLRLKCMFLEDKEEGLM